MHTKDDFCYAMVVMDWTGSWTEEGEKEFVAAPSNTEIVGQVAASLWMYTNAITCTCQKNMDEFREK